jgi:hypothetical protein
MKNILIVAAAFLMTVSSMAHRVPTESDTWSKIRSHYATVEVAEPSVKLDNGPMTSAFFVCKEGEQLRTLKQLTKCVKWSRHTGNRDRDNRRCLEELNYFGYAAIEGTRERCVKWRTIRHGDDNERVCVAYEDYNYSLPLSHEVSVYAKTRGGRDRDERRGRKLFTKTLSIEDCE